MVAGLRFDRAGQRWPQSPAGLGLGRRWLGFAPACPPRPCGSLMASSAGRAECVPGSTPTYRPCPCGSPIGLKRRPGYEGRGFSGAWVGWGRAGVPPHKLHGAGSIGVWRPCVQFAAGAPRHVPTPRSRTRPTAGGGGTRPSPMTRSSTVATVVGSAGHKDQLGTVCLFSSHRRDDADETGGWGRAGVPPQQTAHTAALKRLTPHLAVCEEVPRCGPARPNRRTHRAPNSPAGV
ncbi:hypothetical protein C0Q58_11705 [Streptomyces albidoflavus]|nr:hypothetical protein C0Q58_11705 [Streptomyces albidoflavus]